MKMLDEMCEVELQEMVASLKKRNDSLRSSLEMIRAGIESGDLIYALARVTAILEATKEDEK